jgi:hypothetical protein
MKLDKKTYEALRRIVVHFCWDEARHYAETGKPGRHIYRDLLTVARYLDKQPRPKR